jgi:hypothetical protein
MLHDSLYDVIFANSETWVVYIPGSAIELSCFSFWDC